MEEYKGIYYNDNTEQVFYEGGAHFKYILLFKKLQLLSKIQENSSSVIENETKVIYY